MKVLLSFCTILLAVLSGFVVLKITDNYFYWLTTVIISTILLGILARSVMRLINKRKP